MLTRITPISAVAYCSKRPLGVVRGSRARPGRRPRARDRAGRGRAPRPARRTRGRSSGSPGARTTSASRHRDAATVRAQVRPDRLVEDRVCRSVLRRWRARASPCFRWRRLPPAGDLRIAQAIGSRSGRSRCRAAPRPQHVSAPIRAFHPDSLSSLAGAVGGRRSDRARYRRHHGAERARGRGPSRRVGAPRRPRPLPVGGRGAAPTRAGRPAGGRRRRRQPRSAPPGRRHRLVRGPGVRRALGHAARRGAAPLSRRRVPAVGSGGLRRGLRGGHGGPALVRRPGRGAGLGRGLPRCEHRRPRGARRRHQGSRRSARPA